VDVNRLPPALNIITLATFAASLSARALDPVLPHVAEDFGVSIAAAAGFGGTEAGPQPTRSRVSANVTDFIGKKRYYYSSDLQSKLPVALLPEPNRF